MVELLASMVILTVGVLVAWSAIMSATAKTAGRSQELAYLQTEVRAAVNTLAADLRQAKVPGHHHAAGVDRHLHPGHVLLAGPVDAIPPPPGLLPPVGRSAPARSGDQHQHRGAARGRSPPSARGRPWSAGSRTRPTFTYKDAANNTTTNPSSVASANVTLVLTPPTGLGGASTTYQTNIALRSDTCG